MGVSWVFENSSSSKEIERLLEGGGAESCGSYTVDCLPYTPVGGLGAGAGIQINYVLHHSNFPQTSFSIAPSVVKDNNNKDKVDFKSTPRAICDRGFDLILTKMSSGLTPDSAGKYELTGHEYRMRDFVVRVGTASQVTAVKGVIVEVEYEPSQVASQAIRMLNEFMLMFFPSYAGKKPVLIDKTTPEPYSALDTLFQYLNIFRAMRSRT